MRKPHWSEKPKPGAVIDFWFWADGSETPEVLAQFKADMQTAITERAKAHGVLVTPARYIEKRPGDPHVPDVPKHISGPNVRLVGCEATVIGDAQQLKVTSFLADLDPVDLERLRIVTRRAHKHVNPDGSLAPISDEECDRVIEELGPQAAVDVIRRAVDSQLVH